LEFVQADTVPFEYGFIGGCGAEAFQLGGEQRSGIGRKAVDHPVALAFAENHAALSKVGEVARHLDLRLAQDLLQMANTQWAVQQ
jgi:hypothetical protein